ncbi:IMP 5'-nucleotidase [Aspergillus fumigatus]|nr:IMP 5'-nucleotidase [Aspergillus fumigatus]
MTTRYRVEYALKSHRRDQLIEWIKGLLAVPFVLHSQPTAVYQEHSENLVAVAADTHQRYAEIFRDVEKLIDDHNAFKYQDAKRMISRRRFVAPSFNDIRLTLNTAQLLGLVRGPGLDLVTFDGDVTLYDDGACLTPDNPAIPRIIRLLHQGVRIGIVTAAGYTEGAKYYERLKGLLDAVHDSSSLTPAQKDGLVVMGGESNFLFRFDSASPHRLSYVPRPEWLLDEMKSWNQEDITQLLDIAESSLRACAANLNLPVAVLRKDRAVGVYPYDRSKIHREQLEETVLVVQNTVERSVVGSRLPFCAFNGASPSSHPLRGNDVFVDIGDKSWGVRACQRYFGGIEPSRTLHVGDQFLSAGANDFKARLASTTAWIASPTETVQLLDELEEMQKAEKNRS